MNVAIYSDAGLSGGVPTWACVIIRANTPPVEASGVIKQSTRCTTSCEGAAIANALHVALRRGLMEPGDVVTVRTDNQPFVRMIAEDRAKPYRREMTNQAIATIKAIAERGRFALAVKFVKGHQRADSKDPHAKHNRRADALCTAARKAVQNPAKAAKERAKGAAYKAKIAARSKPTAKGEAARQAVAIAAKLSGKVAR